ncbi:hypothetical protein [Planomonospora algeriensis]
MTCVYGLPPGPRPYPARSDRASRRSRPVGGLGLASLLAGGAAFLTGLVPPASGASALLVLVSVTLGFAALGRVHHPALRPAATTGSRKDGGPGDGPHGWQDDRASDRGDGRAGGRGDGWAGLVLELSAGALLIWSAVALFTVLAGPGASRLDGLERIRGGPAAGCVREAGGQLTCEAGAVQVLQ